MSSGYYDRDGEPITLDEWAKLYGDAGYREVARTTTADGGRILTMWFGTDDEPDGIAPRIFGTTVFDAQWNALGEEERHRTLKDAEAWHAEMVKQLGPAPETPQ